MLARLSNCGELLRAFATASMLKSVAVHQGNDLGYGNNAKDWTIRSQVLKTFIRVYGCSSTTRWQSVSSYSVSLRLKIESGPPEMEP
jgi:hypothetical protein